MKVYQNITKRQEQGRILAPTPVILKASKPGKIVVVCGRDKMYYLALLYTENDLVDTEVFRICCKRWDKVSH
jgi:hypothetical protein